MGTREKQEQSATAFGFTLNGEPIVVSDLSPNVTLLDWVRASGRPGTKQGCAEGDCGACTVTFLECNAEADPTYRSVNSCLVLMPMVAGRNITTVEGLARAKEQGGGNKEEAELHRCRRAWFSPDTYKIPAIGDAPADYRVSFLSDAAQRGTIHGSKAVGEPPLMLALSVREATRDAVAAFGGAGPVNLATPATGEAIWNAIRQRR